MDEAEHPRAPRRQTQLRVQVLGMDSVPVERTGNVSLTGLYIQMDRDVGPVGSLQRLSLETRAGMGVTILSRVVRVAAVDDLWMGRSIVGVAFQFVTQEAIGTAASTVPVSLAISELLRELVHETETDDVDGGQRVRGENLGPSGLSARTSQVDSLGLTHVVLHVNRRLATGETVRLQLPAPGTTRARILLDGRVESCDAVNRPKTPGFRVRVNFSPKAHDAGLGHTMEDALDTMLGAMVSSPPASPTLPPKPLAGELKRVGVTSVIALCQLDRVTGVLRLRRREAEVRVFFREGDIVDAVTWPEDSSGTPRAALITSLGWHDGVFEVSFEPVERPDRVQTPTTALLLDLVRLGDEAEPDPLSDP